MEVGKCSTRAHAVKPFSRLLLAPGKEFVGLESQSKLGKLPSRKDFHQASQRLQNNRDNCPAIVVFLFRNSGDFS